MTQKPIDSTDIVDAIVNSMESDFPDKIRDILARFDGKNVTTRIQEAFRKELPEIEARILRHYGWTELQWLQPDKERRSMMLVRSEASVPFSLAWFVKENPAYFEGRVERNKKRSALLENRDWLRSVAEAFNARREAAAALAAADVYVSELLQRECADAVSYDLKAQFVSK